MKFWIFTTLLGLIALANSCGGEVPAGARATDATTVRTFRPVGLPPGEPLLAGCVAPVVYDIEPGAEPGFWTVAGTIAVADQQALVRVENRTRHIAVNTNVSADRVFALDELPAGDGDMLAVSYRLDACSSAVVCRRVIADGSVPKDCP